MFVSCTMTKMLIIYKILEKTKVIIFLILGFFKKYQWLFSNDFVNDISSLEFIKKFLIVKFIKFNKCF
jgi:hypothetical protein